VYSIVTTLISGALNMIIMRAIPMGETISSLVAALVASRLHCAWTHKIMTMPSEKKPWERRVSCANWKQLLAPTALSILARDFSIYAIVGTFAVSAQFARNLGNNSSVPNWVSPVVAIIPGLIAALSLSIFVMLPAYAALIRKEASLLPEEEETIISFDRTFGGKLASVSSVLSYADAWKSFTSEARKRVVKLYVKFFFIMVALMFVMAHVLAFEFFMVANDQVHEFAEVARQHLQARGY